MEKQAQPDNQTQIEARKVWVAPEFEVLEAEDAQAGSNPGAAEGGVYS